jgi:hypothetical protein
MKITVTRRENLEVEVSDTEVFNAFANLIRQKLPHGLDLYVKDGKLLFYEMVGEQDRQWVWLKDRYPDLVITQETIQLVKFLAQVKTFRGEILGAHY